MVGRNIHERVGADLDRKWRSKRCLCFGPWEAGEAMSRREPWARKAARLSLVACERDIVHTVMSGEVFVVLTSTIEFARHEKCLRGGVEGQNGTRGTAGWLKEMQKDIFKRPSASDLADA